MKINVLTIAQERAMRIRQMDAFNAARTLTQVGSGIYRINHFETNNSLTEDGGFGSPTLMASLFRALGISAMDSVRYEISFRRGVNTQRWYFHIEESNHVSH